MEKPLRWRLGLLASIALALLALLPQAQLWRARGHEWQGAYASFDGDETAYAAYLNALIAGRPRSNDPYSGVDETASASLPESLFSIQFVPAYALALPARLLGLDASTVFIALSPIVAFSASLAIFWLLSLLLRDELLAACGTIIILCLGALASGQVNLTSILQFRAAHAYLPFLRRYVPALPFPFLFLLCAFLWRALTSPARRTAATPFHALAAGATFALLVFSYFYLWTVAFAWLACLALLWLIAHRSDRDERAHALKIFLTTIALACASLVPYALLLARRAATMDKVQALKLTHAPDLFRAPEIIALVSLAVLAAGVWLKRLALRDARVIFAASFALTPFVVFNQQIITGRSLQPVHYEDYVLNYLTLLALVLAVALFCIRRRDESDQLTTQHDASTQSDASAQRFARPVMLSVALVAYGWAAVELAATTRRFAPVNRARDEQMRVAARLAELARTPSTTGDQAFAARPVVLATSFMLADNLPVGAPQTSVLWSPHMHVNSGLTAEGHRERMYQFFYYTNVAPENFHAYLRANPLAGYVLFGAQRVLPRLTTGHPAPVTDEEIKGEARAYADYVAAFTREQAARPTLSFVITLNGRPDELSQLDRWYERDAGERVGDYTIHRVRLRP